MTTAIECCEIVVKDRPIKAAKDWEIRPLLSQFGHFFGHFRRKHQHGTAPTTFYCLT